MKIIHTNALGDGQIISKHSPFTASHHRRRQIVIFASSSKKMTPSTTIKRIASVTELPKHYKAVLLDQFGVLHNGVEAYGPQSISALDTLTDTFSKVFIISNSSRRSSGALTNLQRMGFNTASLVGVITSGEVTHRFLTRNLVSLPLPLSPDIIGTTAFHFTWGSRGAISLEGLNLNLTTDITKADFILAHGTEAIGTSLDGSNPIPTSVEDMLSLLSTAASFPKPPPLIVANPDIVTVHGNSGELRTMPGTLAKHYAQQLSLLQIQNNDDLIMLMGKPASVIYNQALHLLGNLYPSEVVAIGDSLEHDIAGAAAAGIDSVFIAGGIHRNECGMSTDNSELDEEGMERLFEKYKCRPTYICPMFQ